MIVYIQPTGSSTKEDFIENEWCSWAEKESYRDIWEHMINKYVLFVKSNKIFAIAKIEDIYEDYEGSMEFPLRYEFSLESMRFLDVPVREINRIVGYKENYIWRKFSKLGLKNSSDVLDFLGED